MQYRKLGWTNLELSTIGLGTWAHGGGNWQFSWGSQDDADSIATIEKALDAGINWIDTAAVYGFGHAEEVAGRALKKIGKRPIIATKCGRVWDADGRIYGRLTRESVRKECEDSLRRLEVEVIDLYQIHRPDPENELEESWEAISELVEEGKIRYAGVSNFNVAQMDHLRGIHPIASLQPPYSMLNRDAENELLKYCAASQIGVVVYSPMQKGLLTGKVTPEWVAGLPEDDHRRRDPRFQEPWLSNNIQLVERLKEIALRNRLTVSQLAIAWVLRRPEVTSAIVGARRPEQIEETVGAGDVTLSEEDQRAIEDLLSEYALKVG
ncbi:MAG TPA: aldo/keto reductase [Anaerolineaceae bacterium]|nr:aldo/keto reductase [Anaerolineaceae bacterium]